MKLSLSVKQLVEFTERIKSDFEEKVQQIETLRPEERTWENTFWTLAQTEALAATKSVECTLPSLVSEDPEARKESSKCQLILKNMWDSILFREPLYKALKHVWDQRKNGEDEDNRYGQLIIHQMEKNGILLNAEKRERVQENRKRLSELCLKIQQNINEDTTTVAFTAAELKGVTPIFLGRLKKGEREDLANRKEEVYFVSLKAPDYIPVMQSAEQEVTRKRMMIAKESSCQDLNTTLLEEVFKLRNETANLLGYSSHADWMLEGRMASSPANVSEFEHQIYNHLLPRLQKDIQKLLQTKKLYVENQSTLSQVDNHESKLQSWDYQFLHSLLKKKEYQVDEEKIREYFPLEQVVSNTLKLYQELLGLQFEKVDDKSDHQCWHADVSKYSVFDSVTKELIGYFYLDLFPRDGKYGHQCVFPIKPSCILPDGTRQLPEAVIIGNNPKPSADAPSLLKFEEVKTFFHEFGHVMHAICTRVKYSRFAWSWSIVPWPGGVEVDFLEVPSCMLENWVYDEKVLERLSGHYQNPSEKLPQKLIGQLSSNRYLNLSIQYSRQIFMSQFDILVHRISAPYSVSIPTSGGKKHNVEAKNMQELYFQFMEYFSQMVPVSKDTNPVASWYHPVMGYDAGYYGYLWADVYARDMFSIFQKSTGGCLDREMGSRYRKYVLAPGASSDGVNMIHQFLGRSPEQMPFLSSFLV